MKIVPRPEGYDLRSKRSDRNGDGALWKPTDALYDAYEQIKDREDVECIVIA